MAVPHTIDKRAVQGLANDRINSACSFLTNLFDGSLNVSEEEIQETREIIEQLRGAQTRLLRLVPTKEVTL